MMAWTAGVAMEVDERSGWTEGLFGRWNCKMAMID